MEKDDVKELEEKIKRLKLIQYLSVAMNETSDSKELLALMLDKSIELTGADSGSIMLKNKNSRDLSYEVYKGLDPEVLKNTAITVGKGLTGLVFQDGIPRLVNDVTIDPMYIPVRKDVKSELAVPLSFNGRIIGVLNVDSDRKNAFNDSDQELLHTISNQAAQILLRTELYNELERTIKYKDILLDISQETERIYELTDAFDIIMKKLTEFFGIQRGYLALLTGMRPINYQY